MRIAGNLGTRRSLKSLASCKSGLAIFLKNLSLSGKNQGAQCIWPVSAASLSKMQLQGMALMFLRGRGVLASNTDEEFIENAF